MGKKRTPAGLSAERPMLYELGREQDIINGLDAFGLKARWRTVFGGDPGKAPQWLLRMGLEYRTLVAGTVRTRGEVADKVRRRYQAAVALDVDALRRESDFLVERGERLTAMGKARNSGLVTVSDVLIGLLSMDEVPSDARMIELVREGATNAGKFNEKSLAWYKWKFRLGRLKGMDGLPHKIARPKAAERRRKGARRLGDARRR